EVLAALANAAFARHFALRDAPRSRRRRALARRLRVHESTPETEAQGARQHENDDPSEGHDQRDCKRVRLARRDGRRHVAVREPCLLIWMIRIRGPHHEVAPLRVLEGFAPGRYPDCVPLSRVTITASIRPLRAPSRRNEWNRTGSQTVQPRTSSIAL